MAFNGARLCLLPLISFNIASPPQAGDAEREEEEEAGRREIEAKRVFEVEVDLIKGLLEAFFSTRGR